MSQLECVSTAVLADGSVYVVTTCACGEEYAAKDHAGAMAQHSAHEKACDWHKSPAPGIAKTPGTKPAGQKLAEAALDAVLVSKP